MISVTNIADWMDPGGHDRANRRRLRSITVPVLDAHRSMAFYARVFGFHRSAVHTTERETDIPACSNAAMLTLLVDSARTGEQSIPAPGRWAFAVANLDHARQQVWELGVPIARDSGQPDHIYRQAEAWSLFVHDPDGNEIELVELRALPRSHSAARCRPRASAASHYA